MEEQRQTQEMENTQCMEASGEQQDCAAPQNETENGVRQGSYDSPQSETSQQGYGAPQNGANQYGYEIPQNGADQYGYGAPQNGANQYGYGMPQNGAGQYGYGAPQSGANQYGYGMPQGAGQQGWTQTPYQTYSYVQQSQRKDEGMGFGIASMILGIVSVLLFCTCLNWITGILAIIFGIVQLVKYRQKGFAITGIITAAISLLLSIVMYASLSFGMTDMDYDDLYDSYYEDSFDGEEFLNRIW